MTESELIERAALRVGMKSLMNHGAASCVHSEGCNGVTQEHLIAFAREIALHCAVALFPGAQPVAADAEDAAKWREHVGKLDALVAFCPTCCEGKTAAADMTRDEVIFQCGRTSGKSEAARAARPTPA